MLMYWLFQNACLILLYKITKAFCSEYVHRKKSHFPPFTVKLKFWNEFLLSCAGVTGVPRGHRHNLLQRKTSKAEWNADD